MAAVGKFNSTNGLSPSYYLRLARQHTYANQNSDRPVIPGTKGKPKWIWSRQKLGLGVGKVTSGELSVRDNAPLAAAGGQAGSAAKGPQVRELEVVGETTLSKSA